MNHGLNSSKLLALTKRLTQLSLTMVTVTLGGETLLKITPEDNLSHPNLLLTTKNLDSTLEQINYHQEPEL